MFTINDLPKPLSEMSVQELMCIRALTADALVFTAREIRDLQARYDAVEDEINLRGE